MPNLYIIAGCNGAGKTTASITVFPEILHCDQFVNADYIAYGLSPFNIESVAIEAGKIMLTRIEELLTERRDFAVETTLATRSYVSLVRRARDMGYEVTLIYVWLDSIQMAKERVAERVSKGGHNIPEDVIERRYYRGLSNLFRLFMPICDRWMIADNSFGQLEVVARKQGEFEIVIINPELWEVIKGRANEKQ
jgi:predicted ABC-type ATPase